MSTLFELNEHLRRIVALNFPQPLWITAEVSKINESRGHFYLELVQKGENNDILAQAQAVIWSGEYRQLLYKHGLGLNSVLREGVGLKIQVRPDFHERYGLKLQIVDLDPAFTLGQLDLQRRQTIQTLRDQGLFDKNRSIPLPMVLQRIAVISSETAAGLQDFKRQLEDNNMSYSFELHLFAAMVQGKNSEQEVVAALSLIAQKKDAFDCVVIVRGGGSRLDLSSFDGLELCRAVANLPLPVLSGIGHDVDETVLDLVAHRALKTPTAVAEFILQHNLLFESDVLEATNQVRVFAFNFVKYCALKLEQTIGDARWGARACLQSAGFQLETIAQDIPLRTQQLLQNQHRAIQQAEAYCAALHPENVLKRGFSLTTINGKYVCATSEVNTGDTLETRVRTGTIVSQVSAVQEVTKRAPVENTP
jgi:exodeoxyribonuclease VII large subunit